MKEATKTTMERRTAPPCHPNSIVKAAPFMLALFTRVRGETDWKFGVDPESGLRKRPRGVEGVSISRLLPLEKGASDAFSYFPNSFGSGILRTSPCRNSKKFAQLRSNTCERSRLRSADLEALRRQEESRLFADAQLGQQRELIQVIPKVYDLAIPHLGEQPARPPHSS